MPACMPACLPVDATALGEPWFALQPVSTWCYVSEQNYFLQDGVVSPMPNPHSGEPGSLLVWTLPFDLTGMGGPAGK
jgi:hypothetical protein